MFPQMQRVDGMILTRRVPFENNIEIFFFFSEIREKNVWAFFGLFFFFLLERFSLFSEKDHCQR